MNRAIRRMRVPLVLLLLLTLSSVTARPASAVPAVPPNDDFANAENLGSGSTSAAPGSNLWASAEAEEPNRVSGRAVSSVWYRWTAPQSGVVSVRTCDANFDTTLAIFRGPALSALDLVAANDDGCEEQSALRFVATAGTTYYVAVDGYRGAQGSFELELRVLSPPSNDDFISAIDLGNRVTASASGTNRDATVEPREPDHHGRRTIASVWYRWTAPASRSIRIDTCGSDFDTVIAVYVGTELAALTSVGSNDDSCGTRSLVRFRSVTGTTYHIAVAGFRRAQGSIEFHLARLKQSKRRGSAASTSLPGARAPGLGWEPVRRTR